MSGVEALEAQLAEIEAAAWEQFQAAVEQELARLAALPNYPLRRRTIMELALAEVTPGRSWNAALGQAGVVSQQTFYSKNKDWYAGTSPASALFRAVLAEVGRLYRLYYGGQDMRRQEARRRAHLAAMLELTDAGIERLRDMLQFPVSTQETVDQDGRQVVRVAPTFTWSQLATLLATVDKHARLALGLHTDNARTRLDVGSLSDEELESLARGE